MSQQMAHKYPTIHQTFFKGTVKGQINSVYKMRETNPQKIADYQAALAAGDCNLGHTPLPSAYVKKLHELGVDIPDKLIKR